MIDGLYYDHDELAGAKATRQIGTQMHAPTIGQDRTRVASEEGDGCGSGDDGSGSRDGRSGDGGSGSGDIDDADTTKLVLLVATYETLAYLQFAYL